MRTSRSSFGALPDGRKVTLFTVEGASGMRFSVMDYGCTLVSLAVPDKAGKSESVVLGFDTLEGYLGKPMYSGTIVGRFANRISRGRFVLDGREHTLACNETWGQGENAVHTHLHGGKVGFDRFLWDARPFTTAAAAGVRFWARSRDGDEGYPGNLSVTVTYSLSAAGEFSMAYEARTDKPTPVNLTNHAYWNLRGAGSGTILDHEMRFPSTFSLPVDDAHLPTGEIRSVAGTPLDFTSAKPVGRDISAMGDGYDHCFVVKRSEPGLALACTARDSVSGRSMEVWTTKPGIQLYTGNYMDGRTGAGGRRYGKQEAFCVESEHFPDCVNISHFPSCILRPGETYRHLTLHRFSV